MLMVDDTAFDDETENPDNEIDDDEEW